MPGSAYKRFDVPSSSTADTLDDPDIVSFTVPDGEVWYVEGMGYDSDADASAGGNASEISVAISASENQLTASIAPGKLSRSAVYGSPASWGDNLNLGAYAYGGETVYIGIHRTDVSCTGYLNARRIV